MTTTSAKRGYPLPQDNDFALAWQDFLNFGTAVEDQLVESKHQIMLRRNSGPVPSGPFTAVTWPDPPLYDPMGMLDAIGGALVRIPAGLGGVWSMTAQVTWPSVAASTQGVRYVEIAPVPGTAPVNPPIAVLAGQPLSGGILSSVTFMASGDWLINAGDGFFVRLSQLGVTPDPPEVLNVDVSLSARRVLPAPTGTTTLASPPPPFYYFPELAYMPVDVPMPPTTSGLELDSIIIPAGEEPDAQ